MSSIEKVVEGLRSGMLSYSDILGSSRVALFHNAAIRQAVKREREYHAAKIKADICKLTVDEYLEYQSTVDRLMSVDTVLSPGEWKEKTERK